MDIMGVHVCACKVEREKNVEETKGRKAKKKKSEREFGHGKARLMLAIDNKGRKRGGKKGMQFTLKTLKV